MKILMVCLGNICRSPLAHGVMEAWAKENNCECEIDSAGTGNWHIGHLPHLGSIKVARENGIDITTQRCRQLKSKDLEIFDLIFCMDDQNLKDTLRLARTDEQRAKIHLFLDSVHPDKGLNLPDPYGHEQRVFREVFAMVQKGCEAIGERFLRPNKDSD